MSAPTSPKESAPKQKPLLPPPENFWKRYSPRHEMPLSSALSVFLHALVIGLILLVGYLLQLRWYSPDSKPPENDVVRLEGEPEGGSGPAGMPGDGDRPTEVPFSSGSDPYAKLILTTPMETTETPGIELDPETIRTDVPDPSETEFIEKLKALGKEPEIKKAAPPVIDKKGPPLVAKKSSGGGVKGGTLGSGGTGFGKGKGRGVGDGTGTGGAGGPLTRQEFLARRWKFDLSGPPKMHLDKLAKVGFIVGIEGDDGRFYTVADLKRQPAELRRDNFEKYQDAVKWENTRPDSISGVAREMGLKMNVRRILLFLPRDREEKVAQEEMRFAKEQRRALDSFRHVWFDFELRGGVYEPRAKSLE